MIFGILRIHPTKTATCKSLASVSENGLDSDSSGIVRVAATQEPTTGGAIERNSVRPRPPRGFGSG